MKDITEFLNEQLEANVVENGKISSEKEFREFAEKMAKEAFGDEFDEDKFKETVDGFLKDHKDEVEDGKWDELVGVWKQGFTK